MNPPSSTDSEPEQDLAKALWSLADVLREDGLSGTEYVEQLTCLIVLKLAQEQSLRPLNPVDVIGYDAWGTLQASDGENLLLRYEQALDHLARRPGTLCLLFRRAQNRVLDPVKLSRLIEAVGLHSWSRDISTGTGAVYEALLECLTADHKTGAGQYFTRGR